MRYWCVIVQLTHIQEAYPLQNVVNFINHLAVVEQQITPIKKDENFPQPGINWQTVEHLFRRKYPWKIHFSGNK